MENIWTVLLFVHSKIFCWKFNAFRAHCIDNTFFPARTCWIWITLPWWRVHGSAMVEAFPQVRTKPISTITSLVVTMIQPSHGMPMFCWSQCHPKTEWHAARWQTGEVNTTQTDKSGLNRNLQRQRSSSTSWNKAFLTSAFNHYQICSNFRTLLSFSCGVRVIIVMKWYNCLWHRF